MKQTHFIVAVVSLLLGLALFNGSFSMFGANEVMSAVQSWGWLFSAVGMAMMFLKLPPQFARFWAIVILIFVAFVVGVALGLINWM